MESIPEKKRLILESTMALIRERGFHGTTMSLVADHAGVAAGTIYHYFKGKDELIRALYTYNSDRIRDVTTQAIASGDTRKQRFLNTWYRLYEFYIRNAAVLTFFEQYLNSPYHHLEQPSGQFRSPLFHLLEEGMAAGEIRTIKPELLLMLVLGGVSAAAKLKLSGKVRITSDDLRDVAEALWTGIASDSKAKTVRARKPNVKST
ncbi:MAG: TetR/AcrR family transcriptional regulator [Cyclobacteriaceae bacterium]|nr:TetR/AcrR family transcriptional regulator [Cyclobacteriaceae bacterium]